MKITQANPIVAILVISCVLLGCSQTDQPPEPQTTLDIPPESATVEEGGFWAQPPAVRPNPITRSPLIGIVDFETLMPSTVVIEINDGQRTWQIESKATSKKHSVAILGCYPDRRHQISVTATTEAGVKETQHTAEFVTPALPKDFPPLSVAITKPGRMEPGIRMFAVNTWINDTSVLDYGYLIAVDQTGTVVWYCQTGDRTADSRVLNNGNILYQHGSYRYLYEIDIMGRDHRSWYAARSVAAPNAQSIAVDVDTMHHDIVELPNGNFLTLATELRFFERYPTDEFDATAPQKSTWAVCDEIIEFRPDSGEIVKRLPLTEILDTSRFSYLSLNRFWRDKYDDFIDSPCRDWSHANALQYLADANSILVSLRHLNCMLKLDWQTDRIDWMIGDPTGWAEPFQTLFLKPDNELRWPYHQHSPHFTDTGLLLMFDNSNYRAVPFQRPTMAADNSSRVVAFQVDEKRRTVKQVYSYGAEQGDRFYSPFYGDAEILPRTRNLLVTDGGHIETEDGTPNDVVPCERQWARIFEITSGSKPEKLFELSCKSELGSKYGWNIYRCNSYPSLTKPFSVVVPGIDEQPTVHPRGPVVKINPLDSYTPKEVLNNRS
jgi:arylsulfate sulfotransferase